MPLFQKQAQQGYRVPSRLPNIELSDLDEDPEKAKQILEAYEKNLPKYLAQGNEPLFTKEDEWETPPVSTELRIFGSKKDNTTPQAVSAIKKIADVESAKPASRGVGKEMRNELLTQHGTLPVTDFDKANRGRFKEYQQVFGEALLDKYPEYADALKEPLSSDVLTFKGVDNLVNKLLDEGYGEKYLSREEQSKLLETMKEKGYSMEEWDKVQREFYTKNIVQRYKPTDPKGEIEGGARWEPGIFGPRYLTTLAGGGQNEPAYLWQNRLKK